MPGGTEKGEAQALLRPVDLVALREAEPDLFRQGVRVHGQPESTMDQNSCIFCSETAVEEGVEQCIYLTDMLASERTPAVKAVKALNRQLQWTADVEPAAWWPPQPTYSATLIAHAARHSE